MSDLSSESLPGPSANLSGESPRPPAAGKSPKQAKAADLNNYPFYAPRFWHGMRPVTWAKLLSEGKFRVSPSRWPLLVGVTLATPANTLLAGLQKLIFGRRLAETTLHGPPIFIVGHWRSGTTMLHELMVRDERLSSPSTFQCFAPHHFLVSEWFFRRFTPWLLPGKRPMDNMDMGWERPQEDEFALLNLGLNSPYRRVAFPNQTPVGMDYLDFRDVDPKDIQDWLDSLRTFLTTVSAATGRPLVIKSPTHTGRVAQLAAEFPDAKFIHITRDPRALLPSTCRLWQGLDEVQAMQKPNNEGVKDYVIECMQRMYKSFHAARESIEPSRLIDVRYEDLVVDPVGTLRTIYQSLQLDDFSVVEPILQQWANNEHKSYQRNQHKLAAEDEALIQDAWQDTFSGTDTKRDCRLEYLMA